MRSSNRILLRCPQYAAALNLYGVRATSEISTRLRRKFVTRRRNGNRPLSPPRLPRLWQREPLTTRLKREHLWKSSTRSILITRNRYAPNTVREQSRSAWTSDLTERYEPRLLQPRSCRISIPPRLMP